MGTKTKSVFLTNHSIQRPEINRCPKPSSNSIPLHAFLPVKIPDFLIFRELPNFLISGEIPSNDHLKLPFTKLPFQKPSPRFWALHCHLKGRLSLPVASSCFPSDPGEVPSVGKAGLKTQPGLYRQDALGSTGRAGPLGSSSAKRGRTFTQGAPSSP